MKRTILVFSLLFISLLNSLTALAQSYTDKVLQFERLMHEWKSDGYNTGSEKYTQLMSMVTEGCRMSDYVAKSYIDDNNASTFNIKAGSWFQYIKEKKISITLRDLREKTGDDGRRIVYCWIKYTQPGKHDREDFVGFKFDGGRIIYICNDDMELANRIKADSERQVVDNKPTQQQPANNPTQQSTTAGYEWVDLGLPSGTLWATCNVGARNPWDCGDYFAWGETKPKENYSWSTYKYARGNKSSLTKYNTDKGFLESIDDAASVNMGEEWVTPSKNEWYELFFICEIEWVTNYNNSGMNGLVFHSKKNANASIFIPAAGYHNGGSHFEQMEQGRYWSSEIVYHGGAPYFMIQNYQYSYDQSSEFDIGYTIRAVKKTKARSDALSYFTCDYVDLGLPSGTLWATCNVGANTPSENGDRFAWGETKPKEKYDYTTYKYGTGYNQMTKYCSISEYGKDGFTDTLTRLQAIDDAATVNLGTPWRMPTYEDWRELYNYCQWDFTTFFNGKFVKGYIVHSKQFTDRYVFLPCSDYWSSSLYQYQNKCYMAKSIRLTKTSSKKNYDDISFGGSARDHGFRIRPVRN